MKVFVEGSKICYTTQILVLTISADSACHLGNAITS
jgi:hypothetical protein